MDRMLPPHLKRKSGDTTVATDLAGLAVQDKTTRQLAGNTDPCEHELTYGIRYRHLWTSIWHLWTSIWHHGLPSKHAGDGIFDDVVEERRQKMYHTLLPTLLGHPEQGIPEDN